MGSCRFGPACRFSHGSSSGMYSNYSGSGFSSKVSMGVCFQWRDTKQCKFGDACRFSHDGQPPNSFSSFSGQRGVCRNFRDTGECKFGDLCKYSHDLGKEDGKSITTNLTTGSILSSINQQPNTLNTLNSTSLQTSNNSSTSANSSSLAIQGVAIQFNTGAQLGNQQLGGVVSSQQSNPQSLSQALNSQAQSANNSNGNQYFADGDPDADDETA